MNNARITFFVVFLIVATLLLSSFAVAQQAQVRRMPTDADSKGTSMMGKKASTQQDASVAVERTGIQWDGSKSKPSTVSQKKGQVSISDKPSYTPKPLIVPNGRASIKKIPGEQWRTQTPSPEPNPSAVARANDNAAFKRTGAVKQSGTETEGIVDPSFKPTAKTEARGVVLPDFKPGNNVNARVTAAVGLESSMKGKEDSLKRQTSVKITPTATRGVNDKGVIDPSFMPAKKSFVRVVGAVGLESSVKKVPASNNARFAKSPEKKAAQDKLAEKGIIDPHFKPTGDVQK